MHTEEVVLRRSFRFIFGFFSVSDESSRQRKVKVGSHHLFRAAVLSATICFQPIVFPGNPPTLSGDTYRDNPSCRYDKYGATLAPSSGDLIGSGTVGRLVPLSLAAAGSAACQFLLVVGAVSASFWGLGCTVSAGGSWLKARQRKGGDDSAVPAIVGGLVLGNAAGFVVGLGARGTARLLVGRQRS